MSLADEVLARHVEAFCNLCKPTHSRGTCRVCFIEAWPCEAVRLATQLRAAEQVVEAARVVMREAGCGCEPGNGYWTPEGEREWLDEPVCCAFHAALAEYNKGGYQSEHPALQDH